MIVKLGQWPLNLLRGETSFALRAGVEPVQVFFESTAAVVETIFREHKQAQFLKKDDLPPGRLNQPKVPIGPLALTIASKTISGLYVVGLYPSASDGVNAAQILVADQRWLWRRKHVERSYNIPRATGSTRVVSDEAVPLQVAQVVSDIAYRRHSLDSGDPWTIRRMLEDVLDRLVGEGNYSMPNQILGADSIAPPTVLRDPGPQALARVLAIIPGATVVPHSNGRITVLNTTDGSEISLATRMTKARWWGAGWRKVDLQAVRPESIRVGCDQEFEARFNFDSQATSPGSDQSDAVVDMELENVITNPEPSLELRSSGTVASGSLVEFEEWLDSIEDLADFPAIAGPLNDATIRRHYLNGMSVPAQYFRSVLNAPDAVWARRLSAVTSDWRSLFRPILAWREKIRSWSPVRAAILDTETGTRAQAQVWFDYTIKPSGRGLHFNPDLGTEITSYADDLSDATPAPATVSIVDPENGLMRIRPHVGVFGNEAAIAPGHLEVSIPKFTAGQAFEWWNQVKLEEPWELAVILSVVPDSPNDESRLYWEDVDPADVTAVVDGIDKIGASSGPMWEIFASETTARWAWTDGTADATKNAIWKGTPMPDGLLSNDFEVTGSALAHAAVIWATLADRGQGTITTSLDASIEPTGNAQEVTYGVTFDGVRSAAFTRVTMPEPRIPISVWSAMPEGARRILMRLVQQ